MAKKFAWKPNDVFGIPVCEGQYGLGQILGQEKHCMDSVFCCFTSRLEAGCPKVINEIKIEEIISLQIVTRDSLDRGIWPIFGSIQCPSVNDLFPINALRKNLYVGAKIRGSGIMQKFVSAYHRMSAWDEYADPAQFDKILLSGLSRPKNVILRNPY